MEVKNLTCIECPMGCRIEVGVENGVAVYVKGNTCPRGKAYAEAEVVCPMRVLTTTVRTMGGKMLPVKTDRPVKKADTFALIKKINAVHPSGKIRIGDVVLEKIDGVANVVATGNV